MHSIVFYSPKEYHRLPVVDPDISFENNLEGLEQAISTSAHPQPIVCLCCPEPLPIIHTLQLNPNVSIYLCRFHSGGVNRDDVREDVKFDTNGAWKLEIILNRMQRAELNGNQQSLAIDQTILRVIAEQSVNDSNPESTVENQNQNLSPRTPNQDLQSEEVEENGD